MAQHGVGNNFYGAIKWSPHLYIHMTDPYPAEEFDEWASTYDQIVAESQSFPFTGYEQALNKVVEIANVQPGMSILDLGTGTGNLALRFDKLGCELWGTDFSYAMLEKARSKLPQMRLFQADLRNDWPKELNRTFDRIVSAYVFHHFDLDKKVQIISDLANLRLKPGVKIIIADIAFPNLVALGLEKRAVGDEWDDEFFWLADESILALQATGFKVQFHRISSCAGVFVITS
jgi:ubiquinone/menaquinone biosynthesis C-methylase UbiE